ncbi:MAG TPA: helix-turn-helix domain-containing protein [Candidatus Paceibacterota bacterium]|nr:helix-turn-helix domain-containing protein [Candidatus Paceibacterota bacterium]
MEKGYVTIKSASEIIGVSIETLRNWDKTGKLKSKRNPNNGYRLYNISQIQKLVSDKKIKPAKKPNRAKLSD